MKIVSKVLLVLMLITCIAVMMPQTIVKAGGEDEAATEGISIIDGVTIKPDPGKDSKASEQMSNVVNRLLGFLQVASALLAVVMIAATGFRYIMETPEMKNELKKSMIPIIVGILLVFFAASIAKFFIGIFSAK